jgi:hypothetical protein
VKRKRALQTCKPARRDSPLGAQFKPIGFRDIAVACDTRRVGEKEQGQVHGCGEIQNSGQPVYPSGPGVELTHKPHSVPPLHPKTGPPCKCPRIVVPAEEKLDSLSEIEPPLTGVGYAVYTRQPGGQEFPRRVPASDHDIKLQQFPH